MKRPKTRSQKDVPDSIDPSPTAIRLSYPISIRKKSKRQKMKKGRRGDIDKLAAIEYYYSCNLNLK